MDKFKTISSIGIIGLVGLLAYLFWQRGNQIQEINRLEWLLSAKQAEVDTLKVIAEYSVPETVIVSRIRLVVDTLEGRTDTVYEDIPVISGSIEIDTTKEFGPESNPMAVRVWGRFWYPEEYSYRNRLLIYPIAGKSPYLPLTARSPKSWGLGLVYIRSATTTYSGDYVGASVRYKRLTFAGAYDPWRKGGAGTIGFEVLRF